MPFVFGELGMIVLADKIALQHGLNPDKIPFPMPDLSGMTIAL